MNMDDLVGCYKEIASKNLLDGTLFEFMLDDTSNGTINIKTKEENHELDIISTFQNFNSSIIL